MYNKAILIGRLVADPELRTTPNGVNVATFRIAVNRPYDREKTDFITIVCWRQAAEFVCKYFSKGKAIGIEGSIQTRDYTDKDGNKRYAFEVVADRTFFVESKGAVETGNRTSNSADVGYSVNLPHSGSNDFQVVDSDDDLPF